MGRMAAEEATTSGWPCTATYSVCDPKTGKQRMRKLVPNAQVVLRMNGFVVISPSWKQKWTKNENRIKVHSKFIHEGKLSLIWQSGNEMRQFGLSNALVESLMQVKSHLLHLGALDGSGLSKPVPVVAKMRSPIFKVPKKLLKASLSSSSLTKPNAFVTTKRIRKTKSSSVKKVPGISDLDSIQFRVLEKIRNGENVFFTGSAGTGKSCLLRCIQQDQVLLRKRMFVTATTSISAHVIGGITIHQYAGVGIDIDQMSFEELVEKIKKNAATVKRWRETDLLIIDEVSMMDKKLFETLEQLSRVLRCNSQPFGGIQLVLSGDFFQLPPVVAKESNVAFCFESPAWERVITSCIALKKVFRQKDLEFIQMLNRLRVGDCDSDILAAFNDRTEDVQIISEVSSGSTKRRRRHRRPIEMFTHNRDVVKTNERHLSLIDEPAVTYNASDKGNTQLLKGCLALKTLALKVGAQVLLIKTISMSRGLVNGARGIVRGFTKHGQLPIVYFDKDNANVIINREEWTVKVGNVVVAIRQQVPLILAWGISIHKSQGMSLSAAKINLSKTFEYGQAYVALSRVRSITGIVLAGNLTAKLVQAHPTVKEFYSTRNLL